MLRVTSYVWLIHMCDMTHSYMWHDSFICVAWLIHICDMTHSFEWHDSFICMTFVVFVYIFVHIYVWVMSHLLTIHVTHMNESCQTYGWVMSHIWMSHVKHMDESCHTYEWVMSNIWMSHVTLMNQSCHTHGWVMSHILTIHVTNMNQSCHTYGWVMSLIRVSHVPTHFATQGQTNVWNISFTRVTWLIHTCDMTYSHVWHDSFTRVTWLIHMCDSWICVKRHIHSYVWHDSFIRVTWLIHMRDMTHSYVWNDSFIRVTWLIHMRDMTHSYVSHDSFLCVTWLIHGYTFENVKVRGVHCCIHSCIFFFGPGKYNHKFLALCIVITLLTADCFAYKILNFFFLKAYCFVCRQETQTRTKKRQASTHDKFFVTLVVYTTSQPLITYLLTYFFSADFFGPFFLYRQVQPQILRAICGVHVFYCCLQHGNSRMLGHVFWKDPW